ncbi:MAG: hypothetical protein KYX67_05810 [Brevundimonas sp.]|jgi:hypothetical protein|nr:hypothetical protein [Brevundimonas sp.]MDK2746814.1 hypothetical protein [Brevundimonas sp.]
MPTPLVAAKQGAEAPVQARALSPLTGYVLAAVVGAAFWAMLLTALF